MSNSRSSGYPLMYVTKDGVDRVSSLNCLLIQIELSSLIIKFKREYMSLTSSFSFIAKELYSFKTRQSFCSQTLDVSSWSLCNFSQISLAVFKVNTWLKNSMLRDSYKQFLALAFHWISFSSLVVSSQGSWVVFSHHEWLSKHLDQPLLGNKPF
jgi:hypothetical protein